MSRLWKVKRIIFRESLTKAALQGIITSAALYTRRPAMFPLFSIEKRGYKHYLRVYDNKQFTQITADTVEEENQFRQIL